MFANIDVDTDHAPPRHARIESRTSFDGVAEVQQSQKRCTEHEGSIMGDAGFNDRIGPDRPNHLLKGHDVIRNWRIGRPSQSTW